MTVRRTQVKKTTKLTLFALTWPIFIEIALHMLMGNADTLMLSQHSDSSVAAVGVSNQLLSLIIIMFGFIAAGTSILVAQYIGAASERKAAEISVVSLAANLVFGLVLSVLIFIFDDQILQLMDIPDELVGEALFYLKVVGGLSFVQALIMTAGAVLRSYGFTKDAMYVTLGMNIINVIGNYLFIFGPVGVPILGVEGVAYATVAARIIGLAVILVLLLKRVPSSLPFGQLFSLPITHLKNLLKIGIPSAGEQLSYNASQLVIMAFIAVLGTEALTTRVYAINLMMFIFLFSIAISQGTQILVSHMVGAEKYEDAYQRGIKSLKLAVGLTFIISLLFSIASGHLLGIFTDNPDIIAVGTVLIYLTILLEPGRSFNLVLINSLRAAGDVRFPAYVGIAYQWGIAVSLSYLFGIVFGLGLAGMWIAFILDEWIRGFIMLRRWRSRTWMRQQILKS
ncbi:MATE family efflux transporter [Jeotgalibacillus proteolyticus]|uniref:MATE family efflux transporter n=1 Tax=Jeotgalibacillus proteolyticus TaxID=2082395 RepID=A0A2S5GH31_9BACL|nr:MATE family efflux transporter [Jeotgalibacillus proteolyticus]PPA72360.1 MATE family efflux transporter [Jeotgalibacillus proteolyticus]